MDKLHVTCRFKEIPVLPCRIKGQGPQSWPHVYILVYRPYCHISCKAPLTKYCDHDNMCVPTQGRDVPRGCELYSKYISFKNTFYVYNSKSGNLSKMWGIYRPYIII